MREFTLVASALMRVAVTDFDDWDIEEQLDTGLPVFKAGGRKITPSLTRHRDVIVTGLDWLPVQNGEVALLVHSPDLYFFKNRKQSLRKVSGDIEADLGTVRDLPGTSILIGGSTNYYHWLIDHLPRLLLARRLIDLPRILINRPTQFQRESLAMVGVIEWEEVGEDESVRCEDLWIPKGLAVSTVPHPAIIAMLREAFPPTTELPRRKLYLSRRDATTRNLTNEAELIRLIPDFQVVTTTGMTFQRQIDLFASADEVLAVHGAGMANVTFCRPGALVREIFTPLQKVTSMQFLSVLGGLRHEFISAKNVNLSSWDPLLGDLEVDFAALKATL